MNKLIKKIIPTLRFKFPYEPDEYTDSILFENYHCHKDFSNIIIADSSEPIENYAKRTLQLGAKCLFSGEHGSQSNQFHVYNVAEKNKLKYRHSTEAYWVKDRIAEIQTGVDKSQNPVYGRDRTNSHMVIVAKNAEGRKDINFALSMANIDGYYYRPRIDLGLLFDIPRDNVIVTSACIAGWNYEDAADIWLRVHEHFGDNFYFEVQANLTDKQKVLNEKILRLSEKYGIEIIAGLDSHYIDNVGKVKRDQILKYKNVNYPEEYGWFMDYPDGKTLLKRFEQQGVLSQEQALRAVMNTNVFVNECEEIVFDRSFKIPSIYKDKTYEEKCKIFTDMVWDAYEKDEIKSEKKVEGIKYELEQIIDSGIVDYFLTSAAIVKDAVENEGGILTTTARGSASSFIINKLIGLTTIDRTTSEVPLIPERFLTKERVMAGMMPDIDLNIAEQEPFIRAAKKYVGENGCYPLMAVEKLKVKAAWQLYAGANDVSPSDANMVSKYIDQYETKLKYTEEEDRDTIHVEDFIPAEYLSLYKESNDYRGITINIKQHACGYILYDKDIRREIGLISAKSEATGKRILCACIEGKMLDDFGLVKEDFLIVDVVLLIYEFFHAIGQPVPTFEELKRLVKDDAKTWDIYAKGATCCINQCEKESTTSKVMKYKPKTYAELSAFIAAIRPGFKSLLSTFLNRSPYSTGEKEIDKILESSAHFMLYQEGIMMVLNYLGLQMGNTYKVIKNISKKKYVEHPEELEKLQEILIQTWLDKIKNKNNFNNVWNIINDSSRYSFNSSHASAMAGDSLYCAYFKAHYPNIFYGVAIQHYQNKNKKDKIEALVKEAMKFYGYKLGSYRFGDDNRKVSISDETKLIYPNMSSIKGFGDAIAETLYELGQKEYDGFTGVYQAMCESGINKTIIDKLIRIDYFEKYGTVPSLLKQVEYYNLYYNMKSISKTKAAEKGMDFEILGKYGHETEKQFNKIDGHGLYEYMVAGIPETELTQKEIMDNELYVFGYPKTAFPLEDKKKFYVIGVECLKSITNIQLYELHSGKNREVKMWSSNYNRNPFSSGVMILIYGLKKQNKKEFTGNTDSRGKRIYADIPDQYEFWLERFEIFGE